MDSEVNKKEKKKGAGGRGQYIYNILYIIDIQYIIYIIMGGVDPCGRTFATIQVRVIQSTVAFAGVPALSHGRLEK